MAVQGNISRTFILGILLNVVFVLIEFFYGFMSHSLSLLADAWHNLGDVAGLAISLFALRMANLKPSPAYTYGYSKGTILASLANAVLLLIAVGSIGYEAVHRFFQPETPEWGTMTVVASIGIAINTATALLFMNKNELNSRAAFLHMATDALVSLAVVVGGLLIHFTHIIWLDPALSLLICFVILSGTWRLLKSSLRLSLDGMPEGLNIEKINSMAAEFPAIKDLHHVHIWALSTTKNAMTAHVLLHRILDDAEMMELKLEMKHRLAHLNIQHATLEFETHTTSDPEECKEC